MIVSGKETWILTTWELKHQAKGPILNIFHVVEGEFNRSWDIGATHILEGRIIEGNEGDGVNWLKNEKRWAEGDLETEDISKHLILHAINLESEGGVVGTYWD